MGVLVTLQAARTLERLPNMACFVKFIKMKLTILRIMKSMLSVNVKEGKSSTLD